MNSQTNDNASGPAIILLANKPRFVREMMRRALRKDPKTHYVFAFEDGEELAILLDVIDARWLVISLEKDGRFAEPVQNHPAFTSELECNGGQSGR